MNKDNKAFAIECSQATANADNKTREEQTQTPSTSQQDRTVNVFDYEVQGFDSEKRADQEMQEKVGPSPLAGQGQVTQSMSHALDDNDLWRAESDEDMADHVEHATAN